MASTRLTMDIKDSIIRDLMKRSFNKKTEALVKADKAFALEIYDALYPADTLANMKALPEGFFRRAMGLTLSTSNSYYGRDYKFDDPKMVGACHHGLIDDKDLPPEILDKHLKLIAKHKKLETDICDAKRTARAIMNSVTTIKRLIEVWPEIKKIAEPYDEGRIPSNVPMVQLQEVNAMFELPPNEEEVTAP